MALIVFQRFFILTGNLQESHMTLFTRKWRSHTTLWFGIAIVYLDPTLLGVTIQLVCQYR